MGMQKQMQFNLDDTSKQARQEFGTHARREPPSLLASGPTGWLTHMWPRIIMNATERPHSRSAAPTLQRLTNLQLRWPLHGAEALLLHCWPSRECRSMAK